jgi:hypothetical protein
VLCIAEIKGIFCLQALPLLTSVVGLVFMILCVAGVIGMQVFAVRFHNICVHPISGAHLDATAPRPFEWSCGGARSCPSPYICVSDPDDSSFSKSIAGFDNIGKATLTAFQVCSPSV